jgi:hypothetical protein
MLIGDGGGGWQMLGDHPSGAKVILVGTHVATAHGQVAELVLDLPLVTSLLHVPPLSAS